MEARIIWLGFAAAIAVAAMLMVACGGAASGVGGYGLVGARHADCGTQGRALAAYLDTGNPTSNDPTYGGFRQQALALQGDQRSLYIRQVADQYIQTCDQRNDAAQAAAAAAQFKTQVLAREQRTCADVQGSWDGETCRVTYSHWSRLHINSDGTMGANVSSSYQVAFDSSGNVIPGNPAAWAEQNQPDCQSNGDVWHADTMLCSPGNR